MLRLLGHLNKQYNVRHIRSFQERRQDQQMKKQQELFKKSMEDLANKDYYCLRDFKREIMEQSKNSSSGFQKLWSGTQPEEAETLLFKKILNAFTPEELTSDSKFDSQTKQDIMQVAQVTAEDLNKVLRAYNFQKSIQSYLRARKEREEPLPETQDELTSMMRIDRPPPSEEQKYQGRRTFSKVQKKFARFLR